MMSKEILIVDDEIGIRELLSEILSDEGYDVLLAENAAQARVVRQQQRPDLVLLDIWMPDMDGISLLKEWKDTQQLTMPVLVMSGHGTIDTAVEAVQMGALGFLEKPIALKKLLEGVANGLRQFVLPDRGQRPASIEQDIVSATEASSDIFGADTVLALELPLREARDRFERQYFERLMLRTGGNMSRAAELSGVERTHLYRKLKQLGVSVSRKQPGGE